MGIIPQMAQYGLNPHSGLLGSIPGVGATQMPPPYPGAVGQADLTPPAPPVPQRKPEKTPPRPQRKPQTAGDQAQYTSGKKGVSWQPGEKGAPVGGQFSGGFGYQPWRRPSK